MSKQSNQRYRKELEKNLSKKDNSSNKISNTVKNISHKDVAENNNRNETSSTISEKNK